MKSIIKFLTLGLLVLIILGLNSCTDTCTEYTTYMYWEPVYKSLDEIRSGIKNTDVQRDISDPGKIYYINNNILINQPNEGIHVINNIDPANPVYRTFIEIPGNFDMAGLGSYLYVDSYIDLVVLDVSDLENVTEVKRVENFFPQYNSYGYYVDENKGVVTGWKEVETLADYKSNCDGSPIYYDIWGFHRGGIAMDVAFSPEMSASSSIGGGPGVGGSLARFTISKSHLYVVDDSNITAVDLKIPSEPLILNKQQLGWGLETIFPYEDMLFVGSNTGMYIMDISNPSTPSQLSLYTHFTSCDPVVVEGDYAYVTLRSGSNCRMGNDVLEVVDISNPSNPVQVAEYIMFNPHGLGIDNDILFICDGAAGLKIFDATDKLAITDNMIKAYSDLAPIDVIPFNGVLFTIAEDGLHQYDYSDLSNIYELSNIPITRGE